MCASGDVPNDVPIFGKLAPVRGALVEKTLFVGADARSAVWTPLVVDVVARLGRQQRRVVVSGVPGRLVPSGIHGAPQGRDVIGGQAYAGYVTLEDSFVMTSPESIIEALCLRYAFGDVYALVPMLGLAEDDLVRIRRICLFGQRLIDMDAEDFDMADVTGGGPEYTALVDRARACRMPQHPAETYRGALESLAPSFRLMLEVLAAQHARHDMTGVVSTIHIMAEYLPLLVWENVWGHAGDPRRLPDEVDGEDSLFGSSDVECAHHRPDSSAAARATRAARLDLRGWQSYLDRSHSNLAHAVGVCAGSCRNPCSVVTRVDAAHLDHLTEANTLALAFADSSIIRLRHSAPVGHGFGVPSEEEVARTWDHSREVIAKRSDLGEAVLEEDEFCLPGLPSFLSALAGVELSPDTLLLDTAALAVDKLRERATVDE